MLRFQLINELVGSIVIDTDDPIDINEITQNVKRSEINDGVLFEIILDVEFIKAGRAFIKQAFEIAGGIDADVTVNVYELNPNVVKKWQLYATGKVNYNKYDVHEDRVTVNIEQTGVQTRIQNRLDIDVDTETLVSENGDVLPPNPVTNLEYHSKTILKQLNAEPGTGVEFSQGDVWKYDFSDDGDTQSEYGIAYGQISTENMIVSELNDSHSLPFGFSFLGFIPYWNSLQADLDRYDTGATVYHSPTGTVYTSTVNNNNSTPGASGTWVAGYDAILRKYVARNPVHTAKEDGVADFDIKMRLKHSVYARNDGGDVDISGSGCLGNVLVKAWFEHRAADNTIKTLTQLGTDWSMPGSGGSSRISDFEQKTYNVTDVVMEVGDLVFVYYTMAIYGAYEQPNESAAGAGQVWHEPRVQADLDNTYVKITSKTTAPVTFAKTILLHEVFQRLCQFHTNQIDCFRSNLLGRTDIVIEGENPYDVDGDGSLIGITNGGNLRGLPDRKLFSDLKSLIEFVNMNFCVGFGFELINGKNVLRLEKKEFFYDKTTKILSLGRVYDVKRKLNPKMFYNQIEIGYNSKIDIGQTNAIDEINTVRRFGIPVINTKNPLKVSTKMKAGGYQIESQRRLTFSTSDGKLDDENFAVSLVRDGGTFKTKTDEGYTFFDNIFDPPSSYNLDLSPARALKNWLKIVASSLIRSTNKLLKFTYGEVNYTAGTTKGTETQPTYENGTVDVTGIEPIWDNFMLSFNAPLSRDQFQLIKANPYGYIEFEDQFGEVMHGFISSEGIEHDSNKGRAEFNLLQVYRNPIV